MRTLLMASMLLACGLALSAPARAADCEGLEKTANETGVRVPGSASGMRVVGSGRLQFHTAPDAACRMNGVFILPGETVDAYLQFKGFASVLYLNPRTGREAQGWVTAARLKPTGTGVAPRP